MLGLIELECPSRSTWCRPVSAIHRTIVPVRPLSWAALASPCTTTLPAWSRQARACNQTGALSDSPHTPHTRQMTGQPPGHGIGGGDRWTLLGLRGRCATLHLPQAHHQCRSLYRSSPLTRKSGEGGGARRHSCPGNKWERGWASHRHHCDRADQATPAVGRGSMESVLLGEPGLVGRRVSLSPRLLRCPLFANITTSERQSPSTLARLY